MDSLGIYVSIPFCKAKCSFCNFASGVFAAERIDGYVARLADEVRGRHAWAAQIGAELPDSVDTLYFGGGTPSLLAPAVITRIFTVLRSEFAFDHAAEITVECAPGQLSDASLAAFQREGVNRLSFGVQSFVDAECAAVGRLHTGAACQAEVRRMHTSGLSRVGIDLIAGLPHQTEASWRYSVEQAIASGVEHMSLYMLEIDDGSRLGREALAGGRHYGAAALPDEDRVADWYQAACEWLARAGLHQYEISNFAYIGGQSRHNRRYWEREPYFGFGLDAHSMLRIGAGGVRWANPDVLDAYIGPGIGSRGFDRIVNRVDTVAAFEESLFLGLRIVEGVDLAALEREFGMNAAIAEPIAELQSAGLAEIQHGRLKLTAPGRMASNEVFERLLVSALV